MSFLYPSPSTCLFLSAWLNVLLCPDPAGQASSQGQAKDYKTDCQTAANGEQEIPQEAPPTGCRGQSSKSVTDSHQKDVRKSLYVQYVVSLTSTAHAVLSSAPEYHPRCFHMATEWKQATSLRQDPGLLHPVFIGGGAEGAGLWQSQHSLHEGNHSVSSHQWNPW